MEINIDIRVSLDATKDMGAKAFLALITSKVQGHGWISGYSSSINTDDGEGAIHFYTCSMRIANALSERIGLETI